MMRRSVDVHCSHARIGLLQPEAQLELSPGSW